MKSMLLLFFIIWFADAELKPRKGSGVVCTFKDKTYSPGDSWHPYLEPFGFMFCMRCVCTENGNIFCALKTCQSITCTSPVSVPDTCCLVCKDHGTSGSSSTEDGNQQLNRGVRHSVDQCPGEPNKARSDRATPPKVRTSPRGLNLSKLNLKGASETTVKILLQRKHQKACLYNGKTYSHGDMWHPVLRKVLECILCTCTDGLQDCKRITCPSQYPCQHPMKSVGKCCKTCPESKAESNQTQCYLGFKNSLLVYKVESSLRVDSPNTVRVIAVERQSTAEVEVQVWKTVEGVLQLMEIGDVQRKDIMDHPENYTMLTTLDEDTWRKFKEEGENLSKAPQTTICEDGIREVVTFLNPTQIEGLCSP
ncbi:chordin-like protein 2 isoform X2 [Seriola dumerili]|uniref:chordin-like protein 2 isoform X2 n=1 Tax=Seriola dumerili TaxID=41447 RepID=UPI000BBE3499|nr:chordin-like protein 2 isoform X2 [Seriola dumerili]